MSFNILKRKRQGGIKLDDEEVRQEPSDEKDTYNEELAKKVLEEEDQKKEEIEKKKVDDLWAAFKADVGTSKQKPKPVVKSTGFCSLTSVVKVKHSCGHSFKVFTVLCVLCVKVSTLLHRIDSKNTGFIF